MSPLSRVERSDPITTLFVDAMVYSREAVGRIVTSASHGGRNPLVVRASATDSSSVSADDGEGSVVPGGASFVGNTTSTVLFFLALAVGVMIAVVFVFFTFRYFVRSKYGLHVYPIPNRNLVTSGLSGYNNNLTNAELQDQIDYIRANHFVRGEILARRLNYTRGGRRRRRGGRYSRMKKLSEEEVEVLFPKKTYHDWLNGGKERDHEIRDGVLQEESNLVSSTNRTPQDDIDLNEAQGENLDRTSCNSMVSEVNHTHSDETETIELQNIKAGNTPDVAHLSSSIEEDKQEELHFTSGTCAICLEVLEDEDSVRGLVCGHVFHADCLDPWLTKRRACCPMCKRDYFFKNVQNDGGAAGTTESDPNPQNTNEPSNDNANTNTDSRENAGDDNNNAGGPNSNTQPHNNDADRNDDNDDDFDLDHLDLEAFRNDSGLQALIQELVPLSERVRSILTDSSLSSLNIEQQASDIADKKYSTFFKKLWWKIMGISKQDLFNWAVLKIYRCHREATSTPANGSTTVASNEDSNNNNNNDSNTPNPETSEANGGANTTNNNASTNTVNNPYSCEPRQAPASDISRDIVEQRV